MTHVCVPTIKRYDLLAALLQSVERSLVPAEVHIIDNGRNAGLVTNACLSAPGVTTHIMTPDVPMGVAASWNWFIAHTPGERFIVNDDIAFAPESLGLMLAQTASFVSCHYGFACFLIRDACIEQVGLFDETISPGYAYFEDVDYLHRMSLAGVQDAVIECGATHLRSQTYAAFTREEENAHHLKFQRALDNIAAKWGTDFMRQWVSRHTGAA